MTVVKLPLLKVGSAYTRPLHPIELSVSLSLEPLSMANMTLPITDEIAAMDWVRIFTPDGESGDYRVSSVETDMTNGLQSVYLEHGACLLEDAVIVESDGSTEKITMTATITAILTKILGYQSTWKIGTVESTDTIYMDLGGMTLLSAISEMMQSIPDYVCEYVQTESGWRVDILQRPTAIECEGRLNRNLKTCEVSSDRQGMCTRVYNEGLTDGKLDSENIATYGVYEEMLTLNESLSDAQKKRIAEAYLKAHDHPTVSVSISAIELGQITGLAIDRFKVGTVCRLTVPWLNVEVDEIITEKSYEDVLNAPESISLTLANAKPDLSLSIAALTGGGGGMANEQEKQKKRFETHFEQTDEYFRLIATDTQWDELENGTLNVYSQIVQTAAAIQSVVSRTGYTAEAFFLPESNYVAGDIVIYDGKMYEFTAAHHGAWTGTDVKQINEMYSSITQNEEDISTLVRKTGINSLGENESLYSQIRQNAESITTKVSAGDIASTINQTAQSVLIQASKINLEGYVTVSDLSATNAEIENLKSGVTIATALKAGTILATNAIYFGDTAGGFRTLKLGNVQSMTVVAALPSSEKDFDHYHDISASESGGVVTLTLGAARSTEGSANFNIADTKFYKDAVSAARSAGAASVTASAGTWTGGSNTITLSNGGTLIVGAPTIAYDSSQYVSGIQYSVSVDVGGKNQTFTMSAQDAYNAGKSAGESAGAAVTVADPTWNTGYSSSSNTFTVQATSEGGGSDSVSHTLYLTQDSSWSSGGKYVYFRSNSTGGTRHARLQVSMPDSGTFSASSRTGTQYGIPITITFTAGGKTYSGSATI